MWAYPFGDLCSLVLVVHDGVAQFDVDGTDHRLDVVRPLQLVSQVCQRICKEQTMSENYNGYLQFQMLYSHDHAIVYSAVYFI